MRIEINECSDKMIAYLQNAVVMEDDVVFKFRAKVLDLDFTRSEGRYEDVFANLKKVGPIEPAGTLRPESDAWDAATVEAQNWLKLHAREYVMIHAISGETCFFMDTFIRDFLKHMNEVRNQRR